MSVVYPIHIKGFHGVCSVSYSYKGVSYSMSFLKNYFLPFCNCLFKHILRYELSSGQKTRSKGIYYVW